MTDTGIGAAITALTAEYQEQTPDRVPGNTGYSLYCAMAYWRCSPVGVPSRSDDYDPPVTDANRTF